MPAEIIVIPMKKGKIYFYFFAALLVFSFSVFLLFTGFPIYTFSKILCWLCALFSLLFLSLLIPIVKAGKGIIISHAWLIDATRLNAIGPIPWDNFVSFEKTSIQIDIKESGIKTDKKINRNYIAAKLKDNSEFIDTVKKLNQNILPGGGMLQNEDSLFINVDMLKCNPDNLLKILKQKIAG